MQDKNRCKTKTVRISPDRHKKQPGRHKKSQTDIKNCRTIKGDDPAGEKRSWEFMRNIHSHHAL